MCQLTENNVEINELSPLTISYVAPLFIPEYYLNNTRDYSMLFDIVLAKSVLLPENKTRSSIEDSNFFKIISP